MVAVGAELSEMDTLARTFAQQSEQIAQVRSAVDTAVGVTTWTGPAAEAFRMEWGQFAPTLARVTQSLSEAGDAVRRRRAAIEAATT
jgi:WXG100 family type VII secretion target